MSQAASNFTHQSKHQPISLDTRSSNPSRASGHVEHKLAPTHVSKGERGAGGRRSAHSNMPALQPAELFYSRLTPQLEARGIPAGSARRVWPADLLRSVVVDLMRETPRNIVSSELWLAALDARGWWRATQRFARSTAAMSVVGYIVGLGDRHLDNLLLDLATGELVHIDYNVCFDKGARLKVH